MYWLNVLTELRNRGVRKVFFLVCDGLKGFLDSVAAIFPNAIVQTDIIHLTRNTSGTYWNQIAKDMKPIYTALTFETAQARPGCVSRLDQWGRTYPTVKTLWPNA